MCDSLTSWRVRGLRCFCLWALDLVERVRAEGCFRIMSDSAGSARVVSGPTWLLVVALLCPLLCSTLQ
ncbi:hypothetical protein Taro_057007 [Colocasia esculenta]|uniref:Uncharacterized protein n=1 Tax=Colocasia esculenta TaxID=4460 RepID=A0A843XZ39_COLES|nr:hypothetical protein [Colocasia esculenta]